MDIILHTRGVPDSKWPDIRPAGYPAYPAPDSRGRIVKICYILKKLKKISMFKVNIYLFSTTGIDRNISLSSYKPHSDHV